MKQAKTHERKAERRNLKWGNWKSEYPLGRVSTKVSNILSLEPPSEASPACISTAIASTTCLSLATVVSQPCSSSANTPTTLLHFLLLFTLFPTTTAATAHAATATVTANPTTTLLPISLSPSSDHSRHPNTTPSYPPSKTTPFQHALSLTETTHIHTRKHQNDSVVCLFGVRCCSDNRNSLAGTSPELFSGKFYRWSGVDHVFEEKPKREKERASQ